MGTLFTGNLFFVYLLGIIVIINYSSFTKIQKIAIIYACNYGLTFNPDIRCRVVLTLLITILFLYEEYLDQDAAKRSYVVCPIHKIMDFLYMYFFQYKIGFIILSIALRSQSAQNFVQHYVILDHELFSILEIILFCLSLCFLFIGIQAMFSNPVILNTFDQMDAKFLQYPYYFLPLSNVEKRDILFRKLEMVADIEDYTFFQRKKSYNFFSFEFIVAVLKKKKHEKTLQQQSTDKNTNILMRVFTQFKRIIRKADFSYIKKCIKKKQKFRFVSHLFGTLCNSFNIWLHNIIFVFQNHVRRLIRGYSTIEMQLIRIIGYKKGLIMGRPKSIFDICRIFKRKVYEIVYSSIFFYGKKRYLGISHNEDYFRYYIIYIYLHTVQTTLNGRTFRPLDTIFKDIDIIDWPIEALFIITLGLSGRRITEERIKNYKHIISKYNLSQDIILKLIKCIP